MKNKAIAYLLWLIVGLIGGHRFYLGSPLGGAAYLLSLVVIGALPESLVLQIVSSCYFIYYLYDIYWIYQWKQPIENASGSVGKSKVLGTSKFLYLTSHLSAGATESTGAEDFYALEKLTIETQKEAIAITLRDFIGSLSERATEGKYFLLTNINYSQSDSDGNLEKNNLKKNEKAIFIGRYPIETAKGRTEDFYPNIDLLKKLLTPDVVKQILNDRIAIACLTDQTNHWDYNFLKASSMFEGYFQALGPEDGGGEIIYQSYEDGEYDTGFIEADDDCKGGYIMNKMSGFQPFLFIFSDPEALE